MDQRERDCVAITHKCGSFLRLDFVDGAIKFFKEKDASHHIQVIGDYCLLEYFKFYTQLADDESVSRCSRRLTMREGIEAEIILKHCRRYGTFEFARVARFLRSAFPEYRALFVK